MLGPERHIAGLRRGHCAAGQCIGCCRSGTSHCCVEPARCKHKVALCCNWACAVGSNCLCCVLFFGNFVIGAGRGREWGGGVRWVLWYLFLVGGTAFCLRHTGYRVPETQDALIRVFMLCWKKQRVPWAGSFRGIVVQFVRPVSSLVLGTAGSGVTTLLLPALLIRSPPPLFRAPPFIFERTASGCIIMSVHLEDDDSLLLCVRLAILQFSTLH